MKSLINIRAHHLNCIPRFYSGGYNKLFAGNMRKIVMLIRKNPNIKIKILVGKLDALCMKCPYGYKSHCIQPMEIEKFVIAEDKKVLKYLKLKENSVYGAKDVFNLAMNRINNKNIKSICKNCIFLDNCLKVGINNSFRKDLNRKRLKWK